LPPRGRFAETFIDPLDRVLPKLPAGRARDLARSAAGWRPPAAGDTGVSLAALVHGLPPADPGWAPNVAAHAPHAYNAGLTRPPPPAQS
jgi:hypothetical protein